MPYALHELGAVPHHHGGLVGAGLCIGAGGRFQSRQSHGADPDLGQPRDGRLGPGGSIVWCYTLMQTLVGSVKKRRDSTPPSRPIPEALAPPKGVRKSRIIQQFTHTNPNLSC